MSTEQKEDLKRVFEGRSNNWKHLDYISAWFIKAADFGVSAKAAAAFVTTNSISQGQQVPILWPLIFDQDHEIEFAYTSFKWANLASHNAGVTVAIIGISNHARPLKKLFSVGDGETVVKEVANINPYLIGSANIMVEPRKTAVSLHCEITDGCGALDGGHLVLDAYEIEEILSYGAEEYREFVCLPR